MMRNLPVIVLANVLLLLVNICLLQLNSRQQVQDLEYKGHLEVETSRQQDNVERLSTTTVRPTTHQTVENLNAKKNLKLGRENIPRVGGTATVTEKLVDSTRYTYLTQTVPNEPLPRIYRKVFYNKSNPVKRIPHHDWSYKRQWFDFPPLPKVDRIDCNALLSGDDSQIVLAKDISNQREFTKVPIYEETYLEWTQDCDAFKLNRKYITVPLTEEEEKFPIAFSISMFTDVEQMERLLRAVYQPQNMYCIHVDVKSSLLIHKTVASIANCFDNVFIASQTSKVKWGDVSVLLPHLTCMRDLVNNYRGKWNYFIDLAGQEFPLRTNYEIVQILKTFNGSNDITASHKKMEQDRIHFQWAYRWSRTYQQTIFYNTFRRKEPPPFDLTVLKGEIHGLFSRRFVEYIVGDEKAQEFLRWCWNTGHASEHYWNTLNYNTHLNVPGGFFGDFEQVEKYSLEPVTRAKHWQDVNYIPRECQGKLVRGICVYGVGDLPWLATRREIIANKFHLTFEYFALDCLEERHRNRTIGQVGSVSLDFDYEYYKNLPTVRHSRKNGL